MRVLYVQPYVPGYRAPLFEELARRLSHRGDSFLVAAGTSSGEQALRNDQAQGNWLVPLTSTSLRTPLGEFKFRRGLNRFLRRADVCVMELDVGNVNAWMALARPRRPALVLWGHGRSYTSPQRPAQDFAKKIMATRADHVMTYSASGRSHLVSRGVPGEAVTTIGNSTDTHRLRLELGERRRRPLDRSEAFPTLEVPGKVFAMYVGGLDQDKRIPFLLEAAAHAHRQDSRFTLLVAGSGRDAPMVRDAARGGHVAWIPRAEVRDLADMAALSRGLWMPGRVGLIAVDAMALGVRVFTTPFLYHAPEFELLRPGRDVEVLTDRADAFATEALESMLRTKDAIPHAEIPSIEMVATNMIEVIDHVGSTIRHHAAIEG